MAAVEPTIGLLTGADKLAADALVWVLTRAGVKVAGAFATADDLRRATDAGAEALDAIVLDLEDAAGGPASVAEVRRSHPRLPILMLCDPPSASVIRRVIDQGVEGVVLKSDHPEQVVVALRHVLSGRSVMPAGWCTAVEGSPARTSLSIRQREVLELASAGLTNEQIARSLVISRNTVKFHMRSIYAKLGVANRVQATQADDQR